MLLHLRSGWHYSCVFLRRHRRPPSSAGLLSHDLMEQLWNTEAARGGKRTTGAPRGESDKRRFLLPSAAPGCRDEYMVRRESTVGVRQKALKRPAKWPFLLPNRRTSIAGSSLNLSPRSVT